MWKINKLIKQTRLNDKHCFLFQHIIQIHLNIFPSINKLLLVNDTFSTWANFLHQTHIDGFVKHLPPYTEPISKWMAFALSPFAHENE